MRTPFEEVIEACRENLDIAVENDKTAQQFLDSFTIWILGFSIGSLAIILGNIEKIIQYFSYWTVKGVIVLLVLSIISGIIHRILLFDLKNKYNQSLFYVRGALSNRDIMQTEIIDVSNIDSIEDIVRLLKLDFNMDLNKELEFHKNLTSERDKQIHLKTLIKLYQETNIWAKTSFDNGLQYITKIMKDVHMFNGKGYGENIESKNPNLRRLDIIQTLCLYFSCLCFISAILVLVIWY